MTSTPQRILVVANKTCPCPGLADDVAALAGPAGHVLVVSPALNSRVRHWVSDVDGAVAAARERLHAALTLFADAGVRARGEIGDSDPLLAIEDALHGYDATHIVVSTHPAPHSNWLERGLIERARERTRLPVLHLESRYGLEVAVAA